MSLKDFDHLTIMRVRTGPSQGDSTERQMLDAINDTGSFRTRIMQHPDGSQTRMKTKGGMPEFITDEVVVEEDETELTVYMESGHLEFTWPGEGNPTASYAAAWRFMDISTTGDYLGYIKYDAAHIGDQDNDPALYEGQDSLAVGYPPKADPAKDTASREAYAAATVAKKVTLSNFPASLYSGKMRKFLQAQYGAKESLNNPLQINVSGTSITLKYVKGDDELVLGLWAHNSPGIYTAADGTYWLLSVTMTELSWYPIKQDEAGAALLKVYKSSTATDRDKLEAYIFAHSFISLADKKTIPITGLPGGAPLAYGWKFNSTGSKASIVLHAQEGSYGSLKWRAYECHLSFSYDAGFFTVSKIVNDFGTWTDGWGGYNIFVPEYDIATRLWCYSIAMSPGVAPAFDFSGVHVYGYYVDDVWTPAIMSRTVAAYSDPDKPWTLDYTGLVLNSYADPDTDIHAWEDGYNETGSPWTVTTRYTNSFSNMSVAFGGLSYSGQRKYSDLWDTSQSYSGVVYSGSVINYFIGQMGTGPACEYTTASAQAYLDTPCGTYQSCPDDNGNVFNYLQNRVYNAVRTGVTETGIELDEKAWTFVIPGFDAESVVIVTKERVSYTDYSKQTVVSLPVFGVRQDLSAGTGIGEMSVTVYTSTVTWYPEAWIDSEDTSTTPPDNPAEYNTYAFNSEIDAAAAPTPLQPGALFEVDKNYPYYDPGMFVVTSHNGRYSYSLNLRSPASITLGSAPRFVGWA